MKGARLAHGWRLLNGAGLAPDILREFIREPVKAVPAALAARTGPCRIAVLPRLDGSELVSRWTAGPSWLEIELAAEGVQPHDMALELLICLGQRAWERTTPEERERYLRLIAAEFSAGITGEIDEDTFELKRSALASHEAAADAALLSTYAAASFAATLAEYVHALWHNVSVRTGPEHLEAAALRRRFELLARSFPPDPGRRLFA